MRVYLDTNELAHLRVAPRVATSTGVRHGTQTATEIIEFKRFVQTPRHAFGSEIDLRIGRSAARSDASLTARRRAETARGLMSSLLIGRDPAVAPRRSFSNSGLSDIALDGDGVLWASDSSAHRVLGFADPTAPDGPNGMPVATTVLGQASFSTFAPSTDDTVSLRNLAGPVGVGVNSAGNALLVSDGGNHRVLRYVDNLPPRVSGAGDFDVELGATRTVQLNITDPEGTAVTLAFLEVDRPTGASLAGTSVTYVATDPDLRVGDMVGFPLVATDAGLPPKSTSVSVTFKIVPQTVSPARAPTIRRAVAAPERGGCGCSSSSAAALPWLAVLVLLGVSGKRRRRT